VTTTTTRPDSVDVAATMRQADTNVFAEARQQFADRLQAYRQGVARMAQTEGMTLPADEAEQLLVVCRDLGIQHEQLSADVVTMIRHDRLTAAVDAVMRQAEQQAVVVAQLQAEADAESAAFVKVKTECDQRVRAAEAKVNEATRRHAVAAAVRPERVDDKRADMVRLQFESPHLFEHVDADRLRRIVAR
jgi:hypothetical protein